MLTQSYPDSGTNMSQLWTRKIILKSVLGRDILVPKPRIVWKDSHLVNHSSNTCNFDLVRQFLLLSTVQNKWNKFTSKSAEVAINCPDRKCCKTIQSMSFQQRISSKKPFATILAIEGCHYTQQNWNKCHITCISSKKTHPNPLELRKWKKLFTQVPRWSPFCHWKISAPHLYPGYCCLKGLKHPSMCIHWDMYPCIIRISIAYKKMIFI